MSFDVCLSVYVYITVCVGGWVCVRAHAWVRRCASVTVCRNIEELVLFSVTSKWIVFIFFPCPNVARLKELLSISLQLVRRGVWVGKIDGRSRYTFIYDKKLVYKELGLRFRDFQYLRSINSGPLTAEGYPHAALCL